MVNRFVLSKGCPTKKEGIMSIALFNMRNMFSELTGKKKEIELLNKENKPPQARSFIPIFGSIEDSKCPSGVGGHDGEVRRFWNFFPPQKAFYRYLKEYFK